MPDYRDDEPLGQPRVRPMPVTLGALTRPDNAGRVHTPRRGDAVEQWLKSQRDASADYPAAYDAADGLLDLYRLHADTGTPLHEHVCEGGDEHCDCLEAGR